MPRLICDKNQRNDKVDVPDPPHPSARELTYVLICAPVQSNQSLSCVRAET